ncbi:MAG: 50S ribosomal protein L11 methyltransferase [Provencibacterium sp.]|jgi:ribosomal protein L11 methyltransferase|nr:50S ribosomal protein L11 methyltransferase [Provencibacterium sp.]
MDWKQIRVYTTHEGIEPVAAILLELGVGGYTVEDAEDFEAFLKSETPHWDYVDESLYPLRSCETSLTVYLADNEQGARQLERLLDELERLRAMDSTCSWGRLAAECGQIREEDWADNWKQYFKPIPVGERLMIKPTWESLPENGGRAVLEIDPSASFGTGTHYTTRLCLEMLEQTVQGGEAVLDMGCGSGILGIACILLGAAEVTAVDIDENAVRIARENYRQNRIPEEKVHTFCGDIMKEEALRAAVCTRRYPVIAANIVADVILAMLDTLKSCLEEEGKLLLSGIITEREEDILTGLRRAGLQILHRREEGGWVALCVVRQLEERDA